MNLSQTQLTETLKKAHERKAAAATAVERAKHQLQGAQYELVAAGAAHQCVTDMIAAAARAEPARPVACEAACDDGVAVS